MENINLKLEFLKRILTDSLLITKTNNINER